MIAIYQPIIFSLAKKNKKNQPIIFRQPHGDDRLQSTGKRGEKRKQKGEGPHGFPFFQEFLDPLE